MIKAHVHEATKALGFDAKRLRALEASLGVIWNGKSYAKEVVVAAARTSSSYYKPVPVSRGGQLPRTFYAAIAELPLGGQLDVTDMVQGVHVAVLNKRVKTWRSNRRATMPRHRFVAARIDGRIIVTRTR